MWVDYWATLLAHWAKKELDTLGYINPDEDCDSGEGEVHVLTEVATQSKALFHYRGYMAQQNILIPSDGVLYKFLVDKPHRIANCVFMATYPNRAEPTLFKVNNYADTRITPDYIAYEDATTNTIDNFDGCSLAHFNSEDFDQFTTKPIDVLQKVLRLFGIKE